MNIALYVTGSIAIYKSIELVRALVKKHYHVRVIMTASATHFIAPLTFQTISKNRVITDYRQRPAHGVLHVDLARWTDLAVVAPATADFIAKMANGLADDFASTALLATAAKRLIVPAMNDKMLANPATQQNLHRLATFSNVEILQPTYGALAEGYSGKGRMLEPRTILAHVLQFTQPERPLKNTRILVTAGSTREYLDPVRFITNASSGKMGYSIARIAQEWGANVTLISGHSHLPVPFGVSLVRVDTTEDMKRAVLKSFPHQQVLIMSAALADFKPVKVAQQKIKKHRGSHFSFLVQKTADVLKAVSRIKRSNQLTVGFAAETTHLLANAQAKLNTKKLDLIAANDVSNRQIGFGSDVNQVTFLSKRGHIRTPVEPKAKVAQDLLQIVIKEIDQGGKH